jgi:transcriptional regulator with XRE-family HTH domain
MESVGKQIRKIREEKEIKLKDLATKLGKSHGYLSKMENGKKPISLKNMQLIADALEVELIDLIPNKEKVDNPFTGEEDWLFVIQQLKDKGFSAGDVYLKFAQESIENDKKGD